MRQFLRHRWKAWCRNRILQALCFPSAVVCLMGFGIWNNIVFRKDIHLKHRFPFTVSTSIHGFSVMDITDSVSIYFNQLVWFILLKKQILIFHTEHPAPFILHSRPTRFDEYRAYWFYFSMHAIYTTCLTVLHLMVQMIFDEECVSRSPSLCSFLQPPLSSALLL